MTVQALLALIMALLKLAGDAWLSGKSSVTEEEVDAAIGSIPGSDQGLTDAIARARARHASGGG